MDWVMQSDGVGVWEWGFDGNVLLKIRLRSIICRLVWNYPKTTPLWNIFQFPLSPWGRGSERFSAMREVSSFMNSLRIQWSRRQLITQLIHSKLAFLNIVLLHWHCAKCQLRNPVKKNLYEKMFWANFERLIAESGDLDETARNAFFFNFIWRCYLNRNLWRATRLLGKRIPWWFFQCQLTCEVHNVNVVSLIQLTILNRNFRFLHGNNGASS